jgi:hydrogenase maturation protease
VNNVNIEKSLESLIKNANKIAFIGIGTEFRSDDYVGPSLIKELIEEINNLKGQPFEIIRKDDIDEILITESMFFLNARTNVDLFLNEIAEFNPDLVLIFDAMWFENGKPGELFLASSTGFNLHPVSTHTIPLDQLPFYLAAFDISPKIYFLGFFPDLLDYGHILSQIVADQKNRVKNYLITQIKTNIFK